MSSEGDTKVCFIIYTVLNLKLYLPCNILLFAHTKNLLNILAPFIIPTPHHLFKPVNCIFHLAMLKSVQNFTNSPT